MLWQQLKGVLSLQSVRDVRRPRVWPKSRVNERSRLLVHVMHWAHEFLFISTLASGKQLNWTDRNNQEWYILVHLRVHFLSESLSWPYDRRRRAVCWHPWRSVINLALKQLYTTADEFFYDLLCTLLSYIGLDYCEITRVRQLSSRLTLSKEFKKGTPCS